MPPRDKLPEPIATLRRERAWPKGIPMPPAGAYKAGQPWSFEDEELLRKYYTKYGTRYAARLLGRTHGAIRERANKLGITEPKGSHWTKAEDRVLVKQYHRLTARELAAQLGRTTRSVMARLHVLGLTAPASAVWSAAEDAAVRKLSYTMPHAELAAKLGRTRNAIVKRIAVLGIPSPHTPFVPTKRDVAYIRKNMGDISLTAMGVQLDVSTNAVRSIALGLGWQPREELRRWTAKDDALLHKLDGATPRREVAARLGRTPLAVQGRAKRLGLTDEAARPWSKADEKRLARLYGSGMGYTAIASKLGRTRSGVHNRLRTLGLTASLPLKRRWNKADETLLRQLWGTLPKAEIAVRLGRSVSSVSKKAHTLGLTAKRSR
jgi:DNA-binding CsgD family transcriptional regulator